MKNKMHRSLKRPWLLAGIFAGLMTGPASAAEWSHVTWDETLGPYSWGYLDPSWLTCAEGTQQSPIDISTAVSQTGSAPLEFHYTETTLDVVNTGHVIEVPYANGSELRVGDETYYLQSLQFHTQSEHKLLGQQFDMEVHLVHANALEQTAIVTVFLKVGATQNNLVSAVFQDPPATGAVVNVMDLLPHAKTSTTTTSDTSTTDPDAGTATSVKDVQKEWKEKKKAWKEDWKDQKKSWKEQWKEKWNDMKLALSELFGRGKDAKRALRAEKADYREARLASKEDFRNERRASREAFRDARRAAIEAARNGTPDPTGDTGGTTETTPTAPYVDEYYSYMGSLTMPPCTEGVKWFVVPHLVDISSTSLQQMQLLVGQFPNHWEWPYNNRPTLPLNEHQVFQHTP